MAAMERRVLVLAVNELEYKNVQNIARIETRTKVASCVVPVISVICEQVGTLPRDSTIRADNVI